MQKPTVFFTEYGSVIVPLDVCDAEYAMAMRAIIHSARKIREESPELFLTSVITSMSCREALGVLVQIP
jgi:hypothetical protein